MLLFDVELGRCLWWFYLMKMGGGGHRQRAAARQVRNQKCVKLI